jgi:hypothetical protein
MQIVSVDKMGVTANQQLDAAIGSQAVASGTRQSLFESRVVDKELDAVRPCERVIAESELS